MNYVKSAGVGAAQAIVGAYLVLVLFFISLILIKPPGGSPGGSFGEGTQELLYMALAGTVFFVWWIIPVGAVFGVFATPAMKRWSMGSGAFKAALLGAGLGFITAALFDLVGGNVPTYTIRLAYFLFPLYCALWCSLYFGWLHRFRTRT